MCFCDEKGRIYTVTAKDGDVTLAELASGDAYTDGSTTIYWHKYIQVDGKWYGTKNNVFGLKITEAGNTDVEYTVSGISFFFECENMSKSRSAAASLSGTGYSGGSSPRHYGNSYWYTEAIAEGGTFNLSIPYTNNNSGATTLKIYTRDSEGNNTDTGLTITGAAQSSGTISLLDVAIPAGSSLVILNDNGDGNGTYYNSNVYLDYIALSSIESFSIVGDFSENGWDTTQGIEMTQSTEDPAIWTAVVENFEITSDKLNYEYKAVANGAYDVYVLPKGDNQNYSFDYDGAGAGLYNLTFTVNTTNNTVELAIEKQPTATVYYVNTWDWNKVCAWAYNASGNQTQKGEWPGDEMTTTGEQVDGHDVYVWHNYKLDAPTTIMFNDGSDSNKTGEYAFEDGATYVYDGLSTVAKTISTAGYATYCSPYALDFSEVSGLTAYIATQVDNSVKFVAVTSVPANTGVLLKGEAGEYNINVVASSETNVSANIFVGVTENTEVAAGIFVLMNGKQGVGFYKTKNAFTVGANTAYLPAAASARSFIGFDGGNVSTAIDGVAAAQESVVVYNLKGQRVAQPTKGLYIVNGKKVMVK